MVAISITPPDPTLEAVDRAIEQASNEDARAYLGMSQIGAECDRALWYSFRMAESIRHSADTLKRFEDGHRGEALQAERLRLVKGIELATHDETGNQYGFVLLGGHVRGHMDGAIHGLLQAPKTWHVWEHKQVGEKKFNELRKLKEKHGEKEALRHWDSTYYGQACLYMECSGMARHYLTCATPGGRQTLSVRTNEDHDTAKRLMAKAERIITAPEPPPQISDDPASFACKFCDFHGICHGGQVPLVNCRTCAHSTPELDGNARWSCAMHEQDEIPIEAQRTGCPHHRYIPPLLRFAQPIDADPEANTVTYALPDGGEFVNGPPPDGFDSNEIRHAHATGALTDPEVMELRRDYGARIVEGVL